MFEVRRHARHWSWQFQRRGGRQLSHTRIDFISIGDCSITEKEEETEEIPLFIFRQSMIYEDEVRYRRQRIALEGRDGEGMNRDLGELLNTAPPPC